MKIIISGAGGLIGSALMPSLEAAGHEVVRLVRRASEAGVNEETWGPASGRLDPAVMSGADAVINLNGRNIAEGRWSARAKEELYRSRLDATNTIVEAIARAEPAPGLLINASAVGYYGDRGDEILDEGSAAGNGFLAELSRDWEAAALKAQSDRTRVVLLRLGMVIAGGGALGRMLLPFKLGLGGPIGSGRQFWPWVAMDDVLAAVRFALDNYRLAGPLNLVSPEETRCSDFAGTLGRVLHRPAILPMPAFSARLALGEMADALLLASARVRPRVLEETGFVFRTTRLEDAIRHALD
jgi:uncharacterized protein (TIGR01777 family)